MKHREVWFKVWDAGSSVVLHGENETCAAAQQLVFARVQFSLQSVLRRAVAAFAVHTPASARCFGAGGGRGSVGCDGCVAIGQRQVSFVQDEVWVIVSERLVVLRSTVTSRTWREEDGMLRHSYTYTHTHYSSSAQRFMRDTVESQKDKIKREIHLDVLM